MQLDLGVAQPIHVDALAVVVHRHCQFLLGGLLPNHVLVEKLLHFQRLGYLIREPGGSLDLVVLQNRVADRNALVADISAGIIARGRDEFPDYVLALMAKRTPQSIIGSGTLHADSSSSPVGGR